MAATSDLPEELRQTMPRDVRMASTPWVTLVSLGLGMLFLSGVIVVSVGERSYDMARLQAHGMEVTGKIVNLQAHMSRGKNPSMTYYVTYRFAPTVDSGKPQLIYQRTDTVLAENYASMKTGQEVAVVYDIDKPARADINVDDRVHRRDPYLDILIASILSLFIFGGGFAATLAFVLWLYYREKSLLQWGAATLGRIVNEEECGGGKGGPKARVFYEFADSKGQSVTGSRGNVPSASDAREFYKKLRAQIIAKPIVIFDPNDSSKNRLYPLEYAACVRKKNEVAQNAPGSR